MSDLIEAMARAMCRQPGSLCVGFCHRSPCAEATACYGDQATAALAALRETHHLIPKDQEPVGYICTPPDVPNAPFPELHFTPPVGPPELYANWKADPLYALEKRHD